MLLRFCFFDSCTKGVASAFSSVLLALALALRIGAALFFLSSSGEDGAATAGGRRFLACDGISALALDQGRERRRKQE